MSCKHLSCGMLFDTCDKKHEDSLFGDFECEGCEFYEEEDYE